MLKKPRWIKITILTPKTAPIPERQSEIIEINLKKSSNTHSTKPEIA